MFERGTEVEWSSQAAGITRTKRGLVVEVVPAGEKSMLMSPYPVGLPRDHESYVIRASVVNGSERQKRRTRLYWPKVKYLSKVEDQ